MKVANRLFKGRNTDQDPNILDPNFYTEAHNVELVGDGTFFSLKNIKGTTKVEDIVTAADTEILGVYETFYKIGTNENVSCLTIIKATQGGTYNIYAYDIGNDVLYSLYQENTPADYLTSDRVMDAKSHAENGIDILYFTDDYFELRQLRCEIPTGFVSNSLTAYDLSLQRRGANGSIVFDAVKVGGSLLSGTYQFTYRMADPDKKRFTKWSSLTLPIHVYYDSKVVSLGVDGTTIIQNAGIGLYTNRLIEITVEPSQEELDNFEYFQLAVVENIYPISTTTENQSFTASLLPIAPVAELVGYQLKSNQKIGLIPIEDIVVDTAPIESAKTLNIKQNRLWPGNIRYRDLTLDDEPTATGSIIVEPISKVFEADGFVATKTSDQSISPAPIVDIKVGWDTGIDTVNDEYLHSGATADFFFTATINWEYLVVPPELTLDFAVEFKMIKNDTTVIADEFTLSPGSFTLATGGIEMESGDRISIKIYSLSATVKILSTGTTFVGTSSSGAGIGESNKVGYFRDEVYRYAAVYEDSYGNKSVPYVLDMSSISGNEISGAIDMKFPSRSKDGGTYSILDGDNNPTVLGLDLTIDNHPSWAVAVEIVRVRRIKRIQYQSPLIPMMHVEGVGVLAEYPITVKTGEGSGDQTDYPDAKPMTSSKVYLPKNLLWPELKDISKNTTVGGGSGLNKKILGETKLTRRTAYDFGVLFPPQSMYSKTPFVPSGNEVIETVDYTLNKANVVDFGSTTTPAPVTGDGNDIITVLSANFYALNNGDYYFHNGFSGKVITNDERIRKINDYQFFDNLHQGGVVGGEKVLQYSELSTTGVTWGYEPSGQRMAVVKLSDSFNDEGSVSRTFDNGVHNAVSGGTAIVSGGGQTVAFESQLTNKFTNKYSGYNASNYIQSLRIVNVVNDAIGDTRYGGRNSKYEFISTGARHTFSPAELADVQAQNSVPVNLEVFGGDCFVAPHTFKLCDSTYSVVNQEKYTTGTSETLENLFKKWDGKLYAQTVSSAKTIPVALKSVGQFVQVFLESEYNGGVMDLDVLEYSILQGNNPVLNVKTEANIRSPLTYNYNINLSKQNDQKVYLSKPEFTFEQNDFPSRFMFSDQKIYNSDVQGFDIIRVLNFIDLDEALGELTKLAIESDDFYAIQERGVVYIPTGQTQLETSDAGSLVVGTSDIVGRLLVINSSRGSQHLKGIKETGSVIYLPDNRNKSVYALSGKELRPITTNNETLFRDKFSTNIDEKNLIGIYDKVRKQYWLADNANHWCQILDETVGNWTANYEFSANGKLTDGTMADKSLFLVGKVGNLFSVYTMYTGAVNQLFGQTVTPRVTVVVNPEPELSKTFDDQMFAATERLDTVDWLVKREQQLGNQSVNGTTIDVFMLDGNYRAKILRDGDGARLRGLRMFTTVKWKAIESALSTIYTKFRLSSRQPW